MTFSPLTSRKCHYPGRQSHHEHISHAEIWLTSTCTASEVRPRARTKSAMMASVAFMVVVDRLSCSFFLWLSSADAQLSESALPPSKSLLLNTWAQQSCDQCCHKLDQSFSHGLMSSPGLLQGCKEESINPTLISSSVWLVSCPSVMLSGFLHPHVWLSLFNVICWAHLNETVFCRHKYCH